MKSISIESVTGFKFGSLTATAFEGLRGRSKMFMCSCECGVTRSVPMGKLRSGRVKACRACSKAAAHPNAQHKSTGYRKTYNTWRAMRARVLRKSHEHYKYYGGKGITIDPSWNDYLTFLMDMGPRPEGKTLDRIDNKKGYCKENCRWADKIIQANNKMRRHYEIDGQSLTFNQWCEKLGVTRSMVYHRTRRGWSLESALKTPKGAHPIQVS